MVLKKIIKNILTVFINFTKIFVEISVCNLIFFSNTCFSKLPDLKNRNVSRPTNSNCCKHLLSSFKWFNVIFFRFSVLIFESAKTDSWAALRNRNKLRSAEVCFDQFQCRLLLLQSDLNRAISIDSKLIRFSVFPLDLLDRLYLQILSLKWSWPFCASRTRQWNAVQTTGH